MEDNKTIFSYIGQLFATYGIIIGIFLIFGAVIGEQASKYSTLFSLGSQGFKISTLLQLLILALIITAVQVIFLTDRLIKNMNLIIRNVLFFGSIVAVMVVFAIAFAWFPVGEVRAWIAFVISFLICTGISIAVTKLAEKAENKKMEQALNRFKGE